MKLIVDELPRNAEDCVFADLVHLVDPEYMEELEESGNLEICEDCGGIILDGEHAEETFACAISEEVCCLMEGDECDYLKAMSPFVSGMNPLLN